MNCDTPSVARCWLDENGPRYEIRSSRVYDKLRSRTVTCVGDVSIAVKIMNHNYETLANRKPRIRKERLHNMDSKEGRRQAMAAFQKAITAEVKKMDSLSQLERTLGCTLEGLDDYITNMAVGFAQGHRIRVKDFDEMLEHLQAKQEGPCTT